MKIHAHIPSKYDIRLQAVLIKLHMSKSEFTKHCIVEAILKIEIDEEEE